MEREENSRYVVISYVCATVITTVLYLIAGHYFKFYYDLNDDILIKDILSGAYTGTPEAHNIQMLYPLAWIFKMLYGINPSIPWFGMIEVGFMWLCMILMLGRTQLILMNNIEKRFWRIMAVIGLYLCETSFGVATQFWEFFMIQYTVVSGMLATTAAFLIFTKEKFEASSAFIPPPPSSPARSPPGSHRARRNMGGRPCSRISPGARCGYNRRGGRNR